MNLVTLVVLCNCTISIGCLLLIRSIGRLRRRLVAIREWCDGCLIGAEDLLGAPEQIVKHRVQFRQLRQLYQQQSIALDRIQTLGILIQISRSLLFRRQKLNPLQK